MNAHELLRTLADVNVTVSVTDAGDLRLAGLTATVSRYADAIRRAKPEIVAALKRSQASDFEERAAIAEFDGGLPRAHAEVLASLHAMPRPDGMDNHDMGRVIDAAARFLEKRNLKSQR